MLCGPRIDPLFFSWLLTGLSKVFVSLTDESAHGTRKLETETIKAFILNVPPQSEQTVIAAYLDRETNKIDQLVEKIEAAIDRLQEYRTALITAAVTGKIDVRNTHQQEAVA